MNENRIALLEQFVREEPQNPFNLYALAMEYYDRTPAKSMELLLQLLTAHPEYLPTYYKAAHLLWDMEKWKDAEDVFMKGLSLAEEQKAKKAKAELKAAYQNFVFDRDE